MYIEAHGLLPRICSSITVPLYRVIVVTVIVESVHDLLYSNNVLPAHTGFHECVRKDVALPVTSGGTCL